jgi:23S rRNA (uracil1939-C5)-methyltransferase
MTITVEKLVAGGFGLFRDPAIGLLPWAVPGDKGDIQRQPTKGAKPGIMAQWHQLSEPSPIRIDAPCKDFGVCGGCQWQMLPLEVQLFWKQQLVAEAFGRIGKLPAPYPIAPVLPTQPFNTRHKVRYQCSPKNHEGQAGQQLVLELVGADPRTRVAPDPCWLITPAMQKLTQKLMTLDWPAIPKQLTIRQGDNNTLFVLADGMPTSALGTCQSWENDLPEVTAFYADTTKEAYTLWGPEQMTCTVAGQAFKVSAESFFQVNPIGAELLIAEILAHVPMGSGHIVDAYGGGGLFAAHLASRCRHLTTIESYPAAHQDAIDNLALFTNITCLGTPVETALPLLKTTVNIAIADPPRAGLSPTVRDWLGQHVTDMLIMVSCDMPTLARDVAHFITMGWTLETCQPIDMFPQTAHLEAVCVLKRPTS